MIPTLEQVAPLQIKSLTLVSKSIQVNDGGMRRLSLDFVPGRYDVICSRGNAIKKHPGNVRFAQLVADFLPKYAKAIKATGKTSFILIFAKAKAKLKPKVIQTDKKRLSC